MVLDRGATKLTRLFPQPWGVRLGTPVTVVLFFLAWTFPAFPGDDWALVRFQGLQTAWLTWAAEAVSFLGWTPLAIALATVTIVGLMLFNQRRDALIVLLGMTMVIIGNALKLVVDRPRPDYFLIASTPNLSSFPSGHAIYAIIFGGILVLLAEDLVRNRQVRRGLQTGLVLLVLAIGASRVYLGFHWPSDVLGGYLFGGVVLLELIWLRNRLKGIKQDRLV